MNSIIVFVAKYFFVISVVVVGVYWLRANRQIKFSLAWQIIVGGILALALAIAAGHLYYDTRPFVSHHLVPLFAHAPDNGFPSDHALLTSFLGFTMLAYSRRIGIFFLVVALLVSAARVAARIHSPIDIVGSFVIAAVAVVIVQVVSRLWDERRRASRRE